jgi:Na+-driven multidrug efflux pump
MIFVNSMINDLGVVESASFGVGCRIDDIINKISMGVQYAAMPMISQNLGAGDHKRAKEVVYKTWIISAILTAFFMILNCLNTCPGTVSAFIGSRSLHGAWN